MISLECGMRYWLYSEPKDMRKSFHTLGGLVRNKIGGDPMNGDVYIFQQACLNTRARLAARFQGRFLLSQSLMSAIRLRSKGE